MPILLSAPRPLPLVRCSAVTLLPDPSVAAIPKAWEGRRKRELVRRLALSVDLSRAFDSLPFRLLKQSLERAGDGWR